MEEQKNKLFVSNLSWGTDDAKLYEAFAAVDGVKVVEAKVIVDRFNDNKSKGFGFVTTETDEMAEKCIETLNNSELDGRQIFVAVAKPMVKRDNFDRGDRGGYGRSY